MMDVKAKNESSLGMAYRQMKLSIDEMTPQFEKKLNEELKLNPLKAKVREATERDIGALVDLYNKSWMTSNTPFSRITIETMKSLYNDPDIVILIGRVYGIDAGFMILDFAGVEDHYGRVLAIGILPRFQHKGLGKFLGYNAWNYVKQKDIRELRSEVYLENTVSYKFIKAMEFEVVEVKTYTNNVQVV